MRENRWQTARLYLRCYPGEKVIFKAAAEKSGQSLNEWAISVLSVAAEERYDSHPGQMSLFAGREFER